MNYQLNTTGIYQDCYNGITSVELPEGSYLVGVILQGNQPAVTYWEPITTMSSLGMISINLIMATECYVLQEQSYGYLDKITPNRLRYLGHVIIDNGETTYHVFEIQSAIYSEGDGAVR